MAKAEGLGGEVHRVGEVIQVSQRGVSQGGDPAGLELGAGWVEVSLAWRQTMGRPHLDDTA